MHVTDEVLKIDILRALADDKERKILSLIMREPMSANDLVKLADIPVSTIYRKIKDLEDKKLIGIERTILMDDGKTYNIYQAAFAFIDVKFNTQELIIDVIPNNHIIGKAFDLFFSFRR